MKDTEYHQNFLNTLDVLAKRGLPGGAQEAQAVALLSQEAYARLQQAQQEPAGEIAD